eukprot:g15233.t1
MWEKSEFDPTNAESAAVSRQHRFIEHIKEVFRQNLSKMGVERACEHVDELYDVWASAEDRLLGYRHTTALKNKGMLGSLTQALI